MKIFALTYTGMDRSYQEEEGLTLKEVRELAVWVEERGGHSIEISANCPNCGEEWVFDRYKLKDTKRIKCIHCNTTTDVNAP